MVLMGERINAQEALRIGLVNKVVPPDQLMPAAEQWAQQLCEIPPIAVRSAKEAMTKGIDMTLEEGLRLETKLMDICTVTEDHLPKPRRLSWRRENRTSRESSLAETVPVRCQGFGGSLNRGVGCLQPEVQGCSRARAGSSFARATHRGCEGRSSLRSLSPKSGGQGVEIGRPARPGRIAMRPYVVTEDGAAGCCRGSEGVPQFSSLSPKSGGPRGLKRAQRQPSVSIYV